MHYGTLITCLSLAAGALAHPESAEKRQTTYVGQETQLTFFGYPDNCDSTGCYYAETAYSCANPDGSTRDGAGGDGTFDNPLSMAFQMGGNFQECQIVYLTYLQKFGILDGLCASCDVNHIDIWVDSSCSDNPSNVCACEDQLTPTNGDQYVYYGIMADDPSVFNVDTTALYDESAQSCSGHTYQETSGKVKRDTAGQCQSLNPRVGRATQEDLNVVEEKWLLSKRQTGACAENSCQCPSC
ncbi:hypothetical protein LTR85_008683 [Meristemomyces frigidus]|nr:hypothetical protein LTR85_008683 [Meristemomyces frigidus]